MSNQTIDRTAPYELLADVPVGTRFTAAGKLYTMAEGFEIEPSSSRGSFNAIGANGVTVKVKVGPRTPVSVLGRRY